MHIEGNIISFIELGEKNYGIILKKRSDSSFVVLDIYGNIKTIYLEDEITTEGEINLNSVNILLDYYKHYLEIIREEEIIRQYKEELEKKICKSQDKIKEIDKLKEKTIENIDIYTYSKLNERFAEILNHNEKGYEILTDFTHSLKSIVFNRLYTLAEEGTFDIEKLDFISYFDDGIAYALEPKYWSIEARCQANALIKDIDKKLAIDKNILYHTNLEIEDKIIYGGSLKDLTLVRNYKFSPKKNSNKKQDIDEAFIEIASFAKEYLLKKDKNLKYPWQEGYEKKDKDLDNKVILFPWREK